MTPKETKEIETICKIDVFSLKTSVKLTTINAQSVTIKAVNTGMFFLFSLIF